MKYAISIVATLALLAGCGESTQPGSPEEDAPAPVETTVETVSVYEAAVNNPARSEKDRDRDATRKPAEVLEFFGIEPGMKVLDLFSGGGYYTELLSNVVGPEGRVVAHNNEAYAQYVGDEVITRYGNDRLPNIEVLMAENNELKLAANEYDAVMMILTFHDIFYVDPNNGWPKIDGAVLLAELYNAMKPGAVLGIVDHHAKVGSPRETGGTLHRIDPAIVIADMKAAGFVLDGRSDLLENTEDDYDKNMADPAVRGKTSRFVMRFTKPM
jgi:predicted methyltransferase